MINKIKDLEVSGIINTKSIDNLIIVNGNITSPMNKEETLEKIKDIVEQEYPDKMYVYDLKINDNTLVVNEDTYGIGSPELDEIKIIYQGNMPVDFIREHQYYKTTHEDNYLKIRNVVKIIEFIAPIILDKELKVIDGNIRLRAALDNGLKEVPVVIVDADEVKANFLRLVLNRSSEFQRWEYMNVDEYVDNTPQAQPLLEPLGFFGQRLLPTSFFTDTMVDYKINPFSEIQRGYRQEEGLLAFAEYRRQQMAAKHEEMYKKRKKKTPTTKSLFDLIPKEEDFIETFDVEDVTKDSVDVIKEEAERITNLVDGKEKKSIKRLTPKEKAEKDRDDFLNNLQKRYNLKDADKEELKELTENIISQEELDSIISNFVAERGDVGDIDE